MKKGMEDPPLPPEDDVDESCPWDFTPLPQVEPATPSIAIQIRETDLVNIHSQPRSGRTYIAPDGSQKRYQACTYCKLPGHNQRTCFKKTTADLGRRKRKTQVKGFQ